MTAGKLIGGTILMPFKVTIGVAKLGYRLGNGFYNAIAGKLVEDGKIDSIKNLDNFNLGKVNKLESGDVEVEIYLKEVCDG